MGTVLISEETNKEENNKTLLTTAAFSLDAINRTSLSRISMVCYAWKSERMEELMVAQAVFSVTLTLFYLYYSIA